VDGVDSNIEGTLAPTTRRERVVEGGGIEAERRFDKQQGGR
jgi:hypothetical protein